MFGSLMTLRIFDSGLIDALLVLVDGEDSLTWFEGHTPDSLCALVWFLTSGGDHALLDDRISRFVSLSVKAMSTIDALNIEQFDGKQVALLFGVFVRSGLGHLPEVTALVNSLPRPLLMTDVNVTFPCKDKVIPAQPPTGFAVEEETVIVPALDANSIPVDVTSLFEFKELRNVDLDFL